MFNNNNIWQNLGRGFFVSRIIKFGHSMNMIYHIDTTYGRIFYKNPSLEGYSYIHEIPSPCGIYITTLFIDHHLNKPLIGRYNYIPCLQVLPSIKEIEMEFSSHSIYIEICSHDLTTDS